MFLTANNLFYYLRDAGLVDPNDVVEGRFAVSEVGRRNRNFVVHRGPDSSLFVKQIPMWHPELIGAVRREAACTQLARTLDAGSSMLAASIPTLLRYDPVSHVLVYGYLPERHTLARHVARSGPVSPDVARTFGRVLGRCHHDTSRPGSLLEIAGLLTGEPPWILRVLRQPDHVMPGMNAARRAILDALRAAPAVAAGLDGLAATWRRLCLVHGDIKNDNILVAREGPPEAAFTVIDWELAELGDPFWDVAAALFSFVQPWLLAGGATAPVAAPGHADAARIAAAGAFWSAYGETAGPLAPTSPADLARIGSMIGARLVQFAFELLPDAQQTSPFLGRVLDLARFHFGDPLAAASTLLGLAPVAPWAPHPTQNLPRTLWRAS